MSILVKEHLLYCINTDRIKKIWQKWLALQNLPCLTTLKVNAHPGAMC